MKETHHQSWNANGSKDTFWNLAVLIGSLLILIAGVIDVPHEAPNQVAHAAHQQTTVVR